ncbi:MAG: hypothetical protein AAF539_00190 [Planctomycetota bacterium]
MVDHTLPERSLLAAITVCIRIATLISLAANLLLAMFVTICFPQKTPADDASHDHDSNS